MHEELAGRDGEPARRLTPKKPAIRHLFAHSGNVCAFPGCTHPLIDAHGNFVAELCHIEAAEVGGERFNPSMTNEERRHQSNLLLLCHKHHVETNDVTVWPVARMRELKASHEGRFEEAVARIAESAIVDLTKSAKVGEPKTLLRFGATVLADERWTPSPDEMLDMLENPVRPLLQKLRKLSPDTRAVLCIVLERGEDYEFDVGLPTHELEQATGLDASVLWPHIDTLSRYGIAYIGEDWDGRRWVATYDLDGWPFWRDIKKFCEATGVELSPLLGDLRFDLLD